MRSISAVFAFGCALVLPLACSSPASRVASRPVETSAVETNEDNPFGLPFATAGSLQLQIRKRIGYTTAVEEDWKIPAWVSYRLVREYFEPGAPDFPRLAKFITDTSLTTSLRITHDHYTGTGFDRGHMAPHASMQGRSVECVRESYYLSNIAPQTPALNRTIWKNLEDKERSWTRSIGTIWIITGPIFEREQHPARMSPTNAALGGQVAIPTRFFKILVRREGDTLHALAFVMPNRLEPFENDRDFASWQVSIDDIEAATDLDFFRNLPDGEEGDLEAAKEAIWN